ncbi:hypothetical protein [Methanocaldococcus infernus]
MLYIELKKIDLALYRDSILKFSDMIHVIAKDYPIFKKYIREDINFNRVAKKTRKLRKLIRYDLKRPEKDEDLASYILLNIKKDVSNSLLTDYIIALKTIEYLKKSIIVPEAWLNTCYKFFPNSLAFVLKRFGISVKRKERRISDYETIYLEDLLPYIWFSYLSQYYPNLNEVMKKVKKETPWLTEEKREFWEVVRRRCHENLRA